MTIQHMDAHTAFPILLSLRVAALAMLVAAPVGIAIAWAQARTRHPFRGAVDALILLPMVLPPSVLGFVLVLVLGRRGPIGGILESVLGVRLVFTEAAAIIAACVVALPFVVKTAQPAIESVPPELERVGRSLGLSPLAIFFRVTLPCAWRGVLAALVLAFARAMGEFGATLMFAGNIPDRTNTMPLEIFASYQTGDDGRAFFYVFVLVGVCSAVVLTATRLGSGAGRPS